MWDRSQTPRILMSGSREPGSGRGNVYFWQQCPVLPCQGIRDPGSRDGPAHRALAHKVEADASACHGLWSLWTPTGAQYPCFCLLSWGLGPQQCTFPACLHLSESGAAFCATSLPAGRKRAPLSRLLSRLQDPWAALSKLLRKTRVTRTGWEARCTSEKGFKCPRVPGEDPGPGATGETAETNCPLVWGWVPHPQVPGPI